MGIRGSVPIALLSAILLLVQLETIHADGADGVIESCFCEENCQKAFKEECGKISGWYKRQCWGRCPWRSNDFLIRNLTASFEKVIGQPEAVDRIRQLLQAKVKDPTKPLIMHFAGDNGVGKTFSARIVADAVFQPSVAAESSTLLFDCARLKDIGDVHAQRKELWDKVLAQLHKCPKSVVIIDELEKAHPEVVSVLQPIFEGRVYNGANTAEAIFILTSDFSVEGKMHGKTLPEIRNEITKFSYQVFSREPKMVSLITEVIPFRSMGEDELVQLLMYKLNRLSCEFRAQRLDCVKYNLADLRGWAQNVQRNHPYGNVRALESEFNTLIYTPVLDRMQASNTTDSGEVMDLEIQGIRDKNNQVSEARILVNSKAKRQT